MARIYKGTIYYVDVNEEFKDANNFFDILGANSDIFLDLSGLAQSYNFKWRDDLTINRKDMTVEDLETYFL